MMTNQQTPEIYGLHTVPNKGERPWCGIYTVRADAEHDAKVMRDVTGRHWSVVRLVVADTNDRVPEAWTNLLAYVLQDELHNRLTPRVIDIAYTAFMQAKRPNDEDGGASDWFNDTRPVVRELIAKLRKDLIKELAGAPQPSPAPVSDDTERLEWLLWKLPGDALRYVVGELADTSSGSEFRAAIDAAIAAPPAAQPATTKADATTGAALGVEPGAVYAELPAPGVTSEQRRLIGVIADKIEDGTLFQSGIYPKKDLARFVRNMLDTTPTAPAASPTPPAEQKACDTQLFKFYGVSTTAELIAAQARHIEKLQAKIPPTPSFAPQRVREG